MTIIEFLQEYERNCEGMLEATEQSVYFSLILIWNRLRRPEWFQVSRAELMRKAGIKGQHRMERAQARLEEKGFISTSKKTKTSMRLYRIQPLPTRAKTTQEEEETRAKTALVIAETAQEEEQLEPKRLKCLSQNDPKLEPKQLISQRQSNTEYDSSPSQDTNSNLVSIEREIPPPKLPGDVLETYHGFNPTPTLTETDKLAIWSEEYGTRAVKIAIETAIEAGAHHINYIRSILQNGGGAGNERPKRNARRPKKEDPDKWHKAAERQRKFEERMRAQYGEGWNLPEVPCGDF